MERHLKGADSCKNKSKLRLHFSLFDSKETEKFIEQNGIQIISERNNVNVENDVMESRENKEALQEVNLDILGDGRSCSLCSIKFSTLEEQRAHFKLDWHKYNIKQMLLQNSTVEEHVFEKLIGGDVSSISGSDSESDLEVESVKTDRNDDENNPLMTTSLLSKDAAETEDFVMDKSNAKIHFMNNLGTHMSVYREVLFGPKDIPKTLEELVLLIENLPNKKTWLILMTGGGHFAGAIFSGNNVVVRKTFHRYTVRAQRGTAQGMRDSKQGGHQPKSAGASLRRYNEAALVQDVQNLLESWSEHVEKCDRIFIRVPSNYKWIFFEGKKPPFKKDDVRVRSIPFATRRATFKELEKVHGKLSTVYVHENDLKDTTETPKEKSVKSGPATESICNKNVTSLQPAIQETENDVIIHENSDVVNPQKDGVVKVEKVKQTPSETTSESILDSRDKRTSKDKGTDGEKETKVKQVIPALYVKLYDAISYGTDCEVIKSILVEINEQSSQQRCENNPNESPENILNNKRDLEKERMVEPNVEENMENLRVSVPAEENNDLLCQNQKNILNEMFEDYDETLLHLASRLARKETLRVLLEAGADPTIKDTRGRVPFSIANDKETRNEFRRFMASFPDKFDYKIAQIPSPLTTEMEDEKSRKTAEKKKAQAKARKERQKAKRSVERQEEEERKEKEQGEKERMWFESLSDREKRAIAAERRLGEICFNCSKRLQGLVPFERMSNKYCSTECVQNHRKKLNGVKT